MKNSRTKKHKYHFLYETTCFVNGKSYIGVHSTNDLNDGYIGCGVYNQYDADYISRSGQKSPFCFAVSKHGYFAFNRRIVKFFNSSEEAYEFENKIVDKSFAHSKDNYNATIGGVGGGMVSYSEDQEKKVIELYKLNHKTSYISEKTFVPTHTVTRICKNVKRNPKYVHISKDGVYTPFSTEKELTKKTGLQINRNIYIPCAKGGTSHAKGENFMLYEDYIGGFKDNRYKHKSISKYKGTVLYKGDKEYIIGDSANKFCTKHGIHIQALCYVLKKGHGKVGPFIYNHNKRNSKFKGFVLKKHNKKYLVESFGKTAADLNISISHLFRLLNEEITEAKGWTVYKK